MPKPSAPRKSRITRSISFEAYLLEHVIKLAAAQKRSPNWIVNELVRQDIAAQK